MNFRMFGHEEIKVSEIGLGCWQLGGDWGEISDYNAQKVIETAVENRINFFDTADVYGQGKSELFLYKYLKPIAPDAFIATKLGRFYKPGEENYFSLKSFRYFTENSLKRLNVESLDLTQLHCVPKSLIESGEVFEWLRILQQEGKIKRFGASVESVSEALTCLKHEGLASLQIIFNMFRQNPIEQLFSMAKNKGVSIIARLPLASGLLGGRLHERISFSKDDHRLFNNNGQIFNVGETFSGIPFNKGLELVEEIKGFFPDNVNLSQMALRWILDYDEVTVVIPGSKSPTQISENTSSSRLPKLSKLLHDQLNQFYNKRVVQYIRGHF
tara:strand:- start:69 stop:1052 length:984 start_codon:yes stop_codon:yes gene_type:complete